MTDDRGQALVLAVLALAIAAVTIVGLRAAQDRILADAVERRAGEAAIEAAGMVMADAQLALVASLRDEFGRPRSAPTRADLEGLAADPVVRDRALAAAERLASANGGPPPSDLSITVAPRSFELTLTAGAHHQRASIETRCCRR